MVLVLEKISPRLFPPPILAALPSSANAGLISPSVPEGGALGICFANACRVPRRYARFKGAERFLPVVRGVLRRSGKVTSTLIGVSSSGFHEGRFGSRSGFNSPWASLMLGRNGVLKSPSRQQISAQGGFRAAHMPKEQGGAALRFACSFSYHWCGCIE